MKEAFNVVLAGCGGISGAWLDSVKSRSDVRIVGLMDINPAAAEKRAADYGLKDAIIGTALAPLLKSAKPDIVFDCTIPEAHASITTTALRHGCHVLGEKPMAESLPKARAMIAAARKARRTYAVMQNRRYLPPMAALRRFLDSGELGRLTTVHCDFMIGAHFGGFRDTMKHVLLLDMAIHTFDQARFLTAADPRTVLCHEWNPPGSWYAHGASAVAIFEMTNDIVCTYRGSWCSEGLNTPWESTWRFIGEKGSVSWDGAGGIHAQLVTGTEGFHRPLRDLDIPCPAEPNQPCGHAGCIDEFLRCLTDGGTPQTVCTDNLKSLWMVHAAIDSAKKHKQVRRSA